MMHSARAQASPAADKSVARHADSIKGWQAAWRVLCQNAFSLVAKAISLSRALSEACVPRIRVCGAPASKGAAMEPFGGARGSKKGERDSKYLDSINRFLRGRAAAPKAAARFMIFLVKAAGRKVCTMGR